MWKSQKHQRATNQRLTDLSLLFPHDNRFQHGCLAEHFDLHGLAGLDGPVIAGRSLRRLPVDRRRDIAAHEVCHVEPVQRYFLHSAISAGDAP